MTTYEEKIYDAMVNCEIATTDELNLVRNLMSGSWEEVLNAVCYVRTGWHTMEDYVTQELEEEW